MRGILLFILTFASAGAFADQSRMQARLTLKDWQAGLQYLNENQFDIAGYDNSARTVEVIVTKNELQFLRAHGFQTQVVGTEASFDARYYNSGTVDARLTELEGLYPEIAQKVEIGRTLKDKPIYALKISDDVQTNDPSEPKVLFNSMHHAREVMTTEVVMSIAESLLSGYQVDQKLTDYVDNAEIWLVPMVNPDGNDLVWSRDRMWRKNARGDYGVDINRNYPFRWGDCRGSSSYKYAQDYRGESVASEPETNVMMNLAKAIMPVTDISFHSFGELVLYSFGCQDESTNLPLYVELAELGNSIGRSLPKESSGGTYTTGPIFSTIYPADGGDVDWLFKELGVLAMVIEMNREFQPPYDNTRAPTIAKMKSAWTKSIERALSSGVRGVIEDYNPFVQPDLEARLVGADGSVQSRRIHNDGSFHFASNPGSYRLEIVDSQLNASEGMRSPFVQEEVRVGRQLLHLTY
ncbi:MAG: zinc carboxypeptidase [Bdellovibrionales bacterium]|nr:zinc carboxypeptidase [Bdellovibrionales bacterium]